MSMLPIEPRDYSDGKTKQSFKDETDINKLLQRAQKAGTLSHLEQYEGMYGDFADFDFLTAQINLAKGREVFDALPSELRSEFHQSPAEFFAYVNDPANAADLRKKLPALAEPGRQNLDVSGKTPPQTAPAVASELASETATTPGYTAEVATEPPPGPVTPPTAPV